MIGIFKSFKMSEVCQVDRKKKSIFFYSMLHVDESSESDKGIEKHFDSINFYCEL